MSVLVTRFIRHGAISVKDILIRFVRTERKFRPDNRLDNRQDKNVIEFLSFGSFE